MIACSPSMMVEAKRHPRNGAEPASWEEFVDAMHTAVHCSCCGAGGAGTHAARRARNPHPLFATGGQAWLARVPSAPPLVPVTRGRYILPGVTLRDPGPAPSGPVDLLVDGHRIARIAPAGEGALEGVHVVEVLRGQVVAPALADLHVHMPPDNALRLTPLFLLLTLRHGVVRVRDAGDPDGTATPAALALIASGALPGPDVHYTYSFVGDGPARWGNTLRLERPEQAGDVVAALARAGARWVKAYENLDASRIAALVEAAGAAGLQVMGHVPTALSVEEALLPDAQHGFGVPDPATLRRDHVLNRAIDWSSVTPARIARVVEACVSHGLAMTPTLSTSRNLLRMHCWAEERHARRRPAAPRHVPGGDLAPTPRSAGVPRHSAGGFRPRPRRVAAQARPGGGAGRGGSAVAAGHRHAAAVRRPRRGTAC